MSKSQKKVQADTRIQLPAQESPGPERSAYEQRFFPSKKECLDCFGKDSALYGRSLAHFQDFMRDWRSGMSEQDLNRMRWNFKALQGAEVKKYNIKQIKIMRNYRVTLIVRDHTTPPCICFLEVFPRGDTNERDFARTVTRARRLLEEEQ